MCVFCNRPDQDILASNDLAYAIRDAFPVRPLHTLVIPRRHVEDYFDLTPDELAALHAVLRHCQQAIRADDVSVGGFNVGANVGIVAGQKIPHVHIHLIPRRAGEAPPPPARPDDSTSQDQ